MSKKKCYIASGMRGHKRFQYGKFRDVQNKGEYLGYDVVNPHDLDREDGLDVLSLPANRDWNTLPQSWNLEAILARDLEALKGSDAICLFGDWEKSEGCQGEAEEALRLGLQILDENFQPMQLSGYFHKGKSKLCKVKTERYTFPNVALYDYLKSEFTNTDSKVQNPVFQKTEVPRESESVLEEAYRLTRGDRNSQYGHPKEDHGRTASYWSTYLGRDIRPDQVAVMMILMKVARLGHSPAHRDSLTDIAGYADCCYRIVADKA